MFLTTITTLNIPPVLVEKTSVAVHAGIQIISLNQILVDLNYDLYVNGLRQSINNYTISNNILTVLQDVGVLIGDTIEFKYYSST